MNIARRSAALLLIAFAPVGAQGLPDRLTDQEFWKLVTDISEPGGFFRSDNFLSNERQLQYPIPGLQRTIKPGGVYFGVGPEQNFAYIVGLQPKLAIIFDIRRQNMIEHLMYKVLFETSSDRAEFMSKLFCRSRPAGLDTTSTITTLVSAYRTADADTAFARRTLRTVTDNLKRRGFTLSDADTAQLNYVYGAFCAAGVDLDYNYPRSRGGGGGGGRGFGGFGMPGYGDLMTATDSAGAERSYLATEANWRAIRSLEQRNLLVPVVGDFAGPKAIRAAGKYVRDHGAIVGAFYASNVEQYLFQQNDDWRKYYENVATLPLDSTSMFIRSVGGRAGFGGGRLGSVTSSIQELLTAYRDGRIQQYPDVIQMSR
jgi:hypothetical protein